MPVQATCPECRTPLQMADAPPGTQVRCPRCKTVFAAGATAANDNGSFAITAAVAKTKAATPDTPRKAARVAIDEEDENPRLVKKNNKSMLPYLLMGGGLVLLLCGGIGSLGGYIAWKGIVALKEKAEEPERIREEAHQRFQEELEKIEAEHERHRAEHNRHREEMQKRWEERQRRVAEQVNDEERDRQEQQKRFEAEIEEHRKMIQEQLKKIGPNNLPDMPNPFGPPPRREVVQAIARSIPLEAKPHEIFGVLWAESDSKKVVIVRMAGPAMRLDQYDPTNGRKLGSMDTPLQSITASIRDVSPDGKYYICNPTRTLYSIWALPNPKPIVEKWQPSPIQREAAGPAGNNVAAAYLLNGPRLLTVNGAGQIAAWSLPKADEGKPTLQRSYVPDEAVARYPSALVGNGIALSPDRTRLAVFNGSDGFLLLDTATLQLQGVVKSAEDALPASDPMRGMYGVAFSPDGKHLAAVFNSRSFRPGAPAKDPQLVRWDVKTRQRTARFADLSKGSGGPSSRVGWWGNDYFWVASFAHPGSLVSWAKQRVVLRASLRVGEKISFGNTDGKCYFLVAGPDGNAVLKSIDLPAEALQKAEQPLTLTKDGILRE